ncbi:MAG TPA: glycosyltransferase family 2 protein [Bacilli bacterium]|nr:glycosyltransferase family 2 protein [Bacilli bacterium]
MKHKDIKFSIIVPAYNIQDYIEKCINSILAQDYNNFEVIIVNDGSTDNCEKICNKYVKKDDRVKYIYKENGGLSSARNKGMEIAKGDYIWFVDGDDYIKETTLSILADSIKKNVNNSDIIWFKNYIDRDNKITKNNIFRREEDICKQYILNQTSAWNKVFKRELLVKNNFEFPLGIIYEDLAVLPSLCIYTDKILFLDEYLYYYVVRTNSIMHIKKFKPNRDDKFIAIDKILNIFKKQRSFKKYEDELEFLCIKHLLVTYSTEILKYNSNIYKPRIIKAVNYIKNTFPNYGKNKYFIKEPFITRFFCKCLNKKKYIICRTILQIARILKRID